MATIEIIRGSTTYNVSAGQSIYLMDVDDLGGAEVRNQEERGPFQDGSTHLDYRLEPRTFTLKIGVVASSLATLDGYRDTLNAMFKPIRGVPITLKITRDDTEVRQIDCQRTGPLGIPLRPEDNAGKLYRSVVQLRAADPTFYNPTEESETFSGPNTQWWTGYATIGTANVLEHSTTPAIGQSWTVPGTIARGSAYSVAFRGGTPTITPTGSAFAWDAAGSAYAEQLGPSYDADIFSAGSDVTLGNLSFLSSNFFTAGTHNYAFVFRHAGGANGTIAWARDGTVLATETGDANIFHGFIGTAGRWRSIFSGTATGQWSAAMPYAAVYNIGLNDVQIAALSQHMTDGPSGSVLSRNIAYDGDWDAYPVITITGPIIDPIITNVTMGLVLDFTGGTIGSTDIWTIDTRYGRKSILNAAGSSVARYLSVDSDLTNFRIAPDPIAAGGTNTITVGGSASGTATSVEITWYNRYLDF